MINRNPTLQIIPEPVSVEVNSGSFVLRGHSRLLIPKGKTEWETAAQYFAGLAKTSTGYNLKIETFGQVPDQPDTSTVYFIEDLSVKHPEGYKLDVKPDHIFIRARTAAGAFYAIQTLRQLFPAQFYRNAVTKNVDWVAACCVIEDEPRFEYRGLHLDVGRHFFKVDFIKRYIDLLAMHKLNTFHWHLTEDQGWRIEIKKYPELQKVASCRKETLVGHYSDNPAKYDGEKYCGYYTQEEVKEVVEYAQKRFVTIIPEIEMPGHAQAALSAYPELGCTGGPYEAATSWGVFKEVFCAGNEKTFAFLDDVLAEVCALFPGPYVHVGGDECPKERWKACPKCQKRMKDEHLKDEHELQSYFIQRAEKMLTKHGKKLIGWDEILEGGLAPTATVMSWRGTEGGIAAAKLHHDVIMSPTTYVYFDYYQADPATEPLAIGGYLNLEKVYQYEPITDELTKEEAGYIKGVQANLWTEYIPSPSYAEYMAYPRACALAEIAWTAKDKRDWSKFKSRLVAHFNRFDAMKLNYSKAFYNVTASFTEGKVKMETPDPNLQIRFTTDKGEPSANSELYVGPFRLGKPTTIMAAAFRGNTKMGKTLTVGYIVHKATGRSYSMSKQPEKYTGGETYALTNGITGTMKTWNNWVALVNHDIDPVIDLGDITQVDKVTTHYINAREAWIYPPQSVEVLISDNGRDFTSVATQKIDTESMKGEAVVQGVEIKTPGVKGRFLKVVLKSFGVIPENAPGAGNGAWLFADEIIVD
jgi:hexosaminidase